MVVTAWKIRNCGRKNIEQKRLRDPYGTNDLEFDCRRVTTIPVKHNCLTYIHYSLSDPCFENDERNSDADHPFLEFKNAEFGEFFNDAFKKQRRCENLWAKILQTCLL